MRIPSAVAACTLITALGSATVALALDQPITGHRLQLKQAGSRLKVVFASKDPGFLFPPVGGPDDPVTNGMTVEIIPATVPSVALLAGSGLGRPGWKVSDGAVPRYQYKTSAFALAGVTGVTLQQGKQIKVTAKLNDLTLPGNVGPVAVRITIGSLRSCALFTGGSIRKDVDGSFLASAAPAPSIADCTDESLGVPNCGVGSSATCGGPCAGDGVCTAYAGGCRCVSPTASCGETYPTCNGACGAGEECFASSPGSSGCVCLPAGSTACGFTGPPTCGGDCASGNVCVPTFGTSSFQSVESFSCTCASPEPCGSPNGLVCPNGFGCGLAGGLVGCAAMRCSNTYPTCGGACGDGGECRPVTGPTGGYCICSLPAPCDGSCDGHDCPPGQVCDLDTSCGCVTP